MRRLVPPPQEQAISDHSSKEIIVATGSGGNAKFEEKIGGGRGEGHVQAIRVKPPESASIHVVGKEDTHEGSDDAHQRTPEEPPETVKGQKYQNAEDRRHENGDPIQGKRKYLGHGSGQRGDERRGLRPRRIIRHGPLLVGRKIGSLNQITGEGQIEEAVEGGEQGLAVVEGFAGFLLPQSQVLQTYPQAHRNHANQRQNLKQQPFSGGPP